MSSPHWIDEMFPLPVPAGRSLPVEPKPPIEIDEVALRLAILRELSRQGIEFAEVSLKWLYPTEHVTYIHPMKEEQIHPPLVEDARVNNQIQKWEYIAKKG